jgi:prolyl 4-hydroxylase
MFIYRKRHALSDALCKQFIETFEKSDEKKPGVLYGPDGSTSESSKKSTDISFHPGYLNSNDWGELLRTLVEVISKSKVDYYYRFQTAMENIDAFDISPVFNMQRYSPGEGFYGWHCERAGIRYSNRVLVWMIYLNSVTDRGETQFLYQNHFEEPEAGKLVIWPSDWTYTHRGIPSPTETKYILTGWFTHIQK